MYMRQARNFMTLNPHAFSLEDSIHTVTEGFVRKHLTSAPVVDQYGKYIGMVSEVCLIKIFALDKTLFGNQKTLKERSQLLDPPESVHLGDGVDKVLKLLLKSKLHRIAVLDSSDRIQGIISPKDILRTLQGDQNQASHNNRAQLNETQSTIEEFVESGNSVDGAMDYYKQIYENAPYMIHSVAPDGTIVACNRKMHEVLGFLPGLLIGKKIEDLYGEEFHEDVRDSLKVLIQGGGPITVLSEMKSADGKLIAVEVQSSIFQNGRREVAGTISVTRQLKESFSDMLSKDMKDILEEFE